MDEWIKRLHRLPEEQQKMVVEDLKTALRNRVVVMERINRRRVRARKLRKAAAIVGRMENGETCG